MIPSALKEIFVVHTGGSNDLGGSFSLSLERAEAHAQDLIRSVLPLGALPLVQKYVPEQPIPMFLACPCCGLRHIDEGEYSTKPNHTHACQRCGLCWRPAVVDTVGVQFLPGFKNEATP